MAFDFSVREGRTKRIQLTGKDANNLPYNWTGKTISIIVKAKSSETTAALLFTLTVSGTGVGTSNPPNRMFLGRADPANLSGPLIDTAATTGYIVVRFAPADSRSLVTTANKTFFWESAVDLPNADTNLEDAYEMPDGTITITDSLFDN